jgi:membrane-associated protease RseP (regulator of RpoE activity)
MRLWPARPRRRPVVPPPGDVLVTEEQLRESVEDVLVVRDRQVRGSVIVFRGLLTMEPGRALERLIDRFRPFGYTPFLRQEGDTVAVQAWPLADSSVPSRPGVNLLLFVLTCLSTLFVSWLSIVGSPTFDALRSSPTILRFFAGLPFAFTLMTILVVHEFGHYFTARYHGAAVSLPYFIPFPLGLGTLGAIILMRSPARDRNSLFDIAAAGPLAGLAIAFPAIVLGLHWSYVVPMPSGGDAGFASLLTWGLTYLFFGPIPPGYMLFTHPIADAAWAGFIVTALNLFPVGQLDGGRITYALFGRHHRTIGKTTVTGLILLGVASFVWNLTTSSGGVMLAIGSSVNWFLWAGLISFLVGFHHTPPMNDLSPISPLRRTIGIACLIMLVLMVPRLQIR